MKYILHLFILIFYISRIQSSIYTDIKENVLSFLQRAIDQNDEEEYIKPRTYQSENKRYFNIQRDLKDAKIAKDKAKVLKKLKNQEENIKIKHELAIPDHQEIKIAKEHYHMDPVLNLFKRRSDKDLRRKAVDSDDSSSSLELKPWKDEWREHWIQKKFEAVNASAHRGETVNMVAARPWGVPCGDPNQHDMPWGTCMLPMECEPEYRIYRGDYFCGRTQFVCCAIQQSTYDMYQGFDVSFADSSLSTDSDEKKNRGKGSRERRQHKKRRDKRKRRRERHKRKRNIKRNIRKIVKEIRKILSRTYRNGTSERKRKTRQLKRFIKELKKQYRKDRQAVKDIHETELIKVDAALQKRLDHIMELNHNFIRNSTFRDIVVNGTITRQGARMLVQAYPELSSYFNMRRRGNEERPRDYLEYNVDYGMVYN
ncbi:uncharacterized protein LOC115449845 [Manduca sexta]|uniref:uncharacterized protein LOC115449845 n=1 Tax=Manduca sexta TaxID=7130 RepID=UPI00188E6845|nr:uncharacterized protein LOC115449845 [Manduca sexta]